MTRKEMTGTRCLIFSQWIRGKLPASNEGFAASDLDFVLWNWKTKRVMLLEIKTRNAKPRPFQRLMWGRISKWIAAGIDGDWTNLGFHLLVFERTGFDDGRLFFDGVEISEQDLIKILSLN